MLGHDLNNIISLRQLAEKGIRKKWQKNAPFQKGS